MSLMNLAIITFFLIVLNAPAVQILIAIHVLEQIRKYYHKRKHHKKIARWRIEYI